MSKFVVYFGLIISFGLSGCASLEKSRLAGAAIGSVAGGSLGAITSHNSSGGTRPEAVLVGAAIGGLFGALIGNETHKANQKKSALDSFNANSTRVEIFGGGADGGKAPRLKPAQVKVRHVEDQIKDGKFIPAHFEYEISEPAQWQK